MHNAALAQRSALAPGRLRYETLSKPTSGAEAALEEPCVQYGYCVEADALLTDIFKDADAYLDAVLIADGYTSPTLMDKHDRQPLLEVIHDWLFDAGRGRGTKSNLPRFPNEE